MRITEGYIDKVLNCLEKIDKDSLRSNLTAWMKQEDLFYSIFDNLRIGLFIVNNAGRISFMNSKAREMLMRPESEELAFLRDAVSDNDLLALIMECMEKGKRTMNKRMHLLKPREKCIAADVFPVFQDDIVSSFVISILDLECEDKDLLLERNTAVLTKLAAGIAHEIGNPLNTVTLYIDLLKSGLMNGTDNQKMSEWLDVIHEETLRLDKIVKNFLKMTRSEVIPLKKGSINACVEEVLGFFSPELRRKNISVVFNPDEELPFFYFDPERMYGALQNIIKNAIEALSIERDDNLIEISTESSANLIVIICRDNGVGIPEADLEKIFDAYHTTKKDGSGLGLMNVYNIVRDHGGRVHVESSEGIGTSFIITLPIRRENLQLPYYHNDITKSEEE